MAEIDRHDLLRVLARHIGAGRGVHIKGLILEISPSFDPTDGHLQRRVRHLVTELRLEGHHICAHPTTGYYLADHDGELAATCEFLYERAMASLRQIAAMRRVSLPDLRGQLRLPS